jgi:hypothetical protein
MSASRHIADRNHGLSGDASTGEHGYLCRVRFNGAAPGEARCVTGIVGGAMRCGRDRRESVLGVRSVNRGWLVWGRRRIL